MGISGREIRHNKVLVHLVSVRGFVNGLNRFDDALRFEESQTLHHVKYVVLVVAGLVLTKLLDGAEAKWGFERVYLGGRWRWFGAHGSYGARVVEVLFRLLFSL